MSLLDELRTAAGQLDPSLQPSSNEVGPILGALIAYTEHGDKLFKAAEKGAGDVSELLADSGEKKADERKADEQQKQPEAEKGRAK